MMEYRKNNPEKFKTARDKWRDNNPEKHKRAVDKWRANNPDKVRRSQEKWRKNPNNKIKIMEYDRNRYETLKSQSSVRKAKGRKIDESQT